MWHLQFNADALIFNATQTYPIPIMWPSISFSQNIVNMILVHYTNKSDSLESSSLKRQVVFPQLIYTGVGNITTIYSNNLWNSHLFMCAPYLVTFGLNAVLYIKSYNVYWDILEKNVTGVLFASEKDRFKLRKSRVVFTRGRNRLL